jgi:50S ribosomal subunit-associated GTPase HflX
MRFGNLSLINKIDEARKAESANIVRQHENPFVYLSAIKRRRLGRSTKLMNQRGGCNRGSRSNN